MAAIMGRAKVVNENKAQPVAPDMKQNVAELSASATLELFEHAITSEEHHARAVACLERCDEPLQHRHRRDMNSVPERAVQADTPRLGAHLRRAYDRGMHA